jgi:glutamate 5-kinase
VAEPGQVTKARLPGIIGLSRRTDRPEAALLIVVKLGTSTLTAGSLRLSVPRLTDLVRQIAALRAAGHAVVLVSSGAMAAGREALGFPSLPKDIPAKQMLAAVGQPRLMALYAELFLARDITVAQVLLTRTDLTLRRSYLNARNTLMGLLERGILPVVNENDTVATEEIRFGDNDNLSALVANLVDAEQLILLTDQRGVFTADPRAYPSALLIDEVEGDEIPAEVWNAAGGTGPELGTGGMVTKLQAADLARRSGAKVWIAFGGEDDILLRIAEGEQLGTRFRAVASAVESRKRYILAGGGSGRLTVDPGAAQALRRGGSLLPVGVVAVAGEFERGDTVRVAETAGREIARGIVNYRSADLERLRGRHSDEIEACLGYHYGDEVIHRNDLVLL